MPEAPDEPLGLVPRDELADEPVRLGDVLEAMEVEALLLERAHEALDDVVTRRPPTYDDVIVIPGHFTSLIHASARYRGPQSHRIRRPCATSFANQPNTRRTPCRRGSSDAQRSPIFAVG
jgi:hypothetical protein